MRKPERSPLDKPSEQQENLPKKTEARQETTEDSFITVCEEIKESVKRGECGYVVITKLKPGSSFGGVEVMERGSGGSSESQGRIGALHDFQDFTVALPKMPEKLLIKECKWEQPLSLDLNTKWDLHGNAAIIAFPIGISQESKKTEHHTTRFLGIKKTREVPVSEWTTRGATFEDLGLEGEGEICLLAVAYINDRSQLADKRQNYTTINFLMSKENANKILRAIGNNPDNFWSFIRFIEPDLLDAAPPAKKSDSGKEGLAFYKIKKPLEAGWRRREELKKIEPFALLEWPEQEQEQ